MKKYQTDPRRPRMTEEGWSAASHPPTQDIDVRVLFCTEPPWDRVLVVNDYETGGSALVLTRAIRNRGDEVPIAEAEARV